MKGVRRDVVEVQEPGDENIEKILVFFKPGCPAIKLGTQEETARTYAQKLITWHRVPSKTWIWAIGAVLVVAGVLLAVQWLL
ncbi:hypothetical protein [uncultured Ruthenibacterium sp.]|uniref:hypothetical protein n=1 Tax=uncultured Ruthenibacterium sp. TaxID=1905347 RepID=UPI00349EF4B3